MLCEQYISRLPEAVLKSGKLFCKECYERDMDCDTSLFFALIFQFPIANI